MYIDMYIYIIFDRLLKSIKGGDPAPLSSRATLLRLHPSH